MIINVLDKGSVELLASCASDLDVVNAARVSFNKESKSFGDSERGILNFLMRDHHGTPFEHGYFRFRIKAPIFVFREWHRHRAGHCLPGSALVTTWNNGHRRRLDELFRLKHEGVTDSLGRTRILPSCQYPRLRVLNDQGEFVCGTAASIYSSGMKDILEIPHERGLLRATADHLVYTGEGWKRTQDLEKGDQIGVQGRVWRPEERSIPPSLRRGIGVWTSMQRRHKIAERDICYICGGTFPFDQLELDHVIPVSESLLHALDLNNLSPVCISCHAAKTFSEEQPDRKGSGRLGMIASCVQKNPVTVSHEMTYDIEMIGPHHNFVADEVVVHNSYNEWSARYSVLEPEFYIPAQEDVVSQVGKPGAYEFEKADRAAATSFGLALQLHCEEAYRIYEKAMLAGVARQQARLVLPVNTYSQMWWSCNPRSLMHFLALRNHPDAQAEIREYAKVIEELFLSFMPRTWQAFEDNGRVAP